MILNGYQGQKYLRTNVGLISQYLLGSAEKTSYGIPQTVRKE